MKTSHYTTPRTLADCEFTVGYPIIEQNKRSDWPLMLVCLAALFLIVWVFK